MTRAARKSKTPQARRGSATSTASPAPRGNTDGPSGPGVPAPTWWDELGELQHDAARLATAAATARDARALVDELARDLRARGVSWAVVAWCTGMTPEGARRRFAG